MAAKKYFIKERNNPQFKQAYYVAQGLITEEEAKRMEEAIYGSNVLHSFSTEEAYNAEIDRLKAEGFNVT